MKYDEPGLNNNELKSLFQAQRAADAAAAPGFARVMARPAPADYGYLRAIALAAAIVLVAVLASSNISQRKAGTGDSPVRPSAPVTRAAVLPAPATDNVVPPPAAGRKLPAKAKPVTLSTWKSPTAALLDTPGDDLWTTVPKIGVGKHDQPKSSE